MNNDYYPADYLAREEKRFNDMRDSYERILSDLTARIKFYEERHPSLFFEYENYLDELNTSQDLETE